MSKGKQADPTETYVLEETAITKASSLDELAELATRQAEAARRNKASPSAGRSGDPLVRRPNGPRRSG